MSAASRLIKAQPTPRTGAAMVATGRRVYVWGGYTQTMEGEGDDRFIVDVDLPDPDSEDDAAIEVLDLEQMQWYKCSTRGSVPQLGTGSTFAAIGSKLYLFGGWNDNDFSADVFVLDTTTFTWEFVETVLGGPIAKYRTGMVVHEGKLIVFGGVGKPLKSDSTEGASYLANKSFNFEFGYGWNNELHEFDPMTKKWKVLECTGTRPPPIGDFTFNKIDKTRALLFGGRVEKTTFNSLYILDVELLYWIGPLEPQSPDQPWPVARCLHASSCIVDPDSEMATLHQKLVTFWGKGSDNKHVHDIWMLDVATLTWKELKLNLRPRMWHMSCSSHNGEMHTDLIVFGGNKRRESKFDKHVMTDLRVLRFGRVENLQRMCIGIISKNWEKVGLLTHQLPPHLQHRIQTYRELTDEIIYPISSDFIQ